MTDWDPALYHRFREYRSAPAELIFERLQLGPSEIMADLGCGTGEHTIELARRSFGGFVTGIDSSLAMIDAALKLRATLDEELRNRVTFVRGDLRNFNAVNSHTVIFSNAAFQWTSDQRPVFAACFNALKPGGRLVVQMPANGHETAQVTLRALAAEPRWRDAIGVDLEEALTVREPEDYRAMLIELGFTAVDCYYHTFLHPMENPAAVVAWSRATVLRRVLDHLAAERHDEFLHELEARLAHAYATTGSLIFTFRRLFLWASRPGC
jgi:trans-aconitate 2-methyltransferase